MIIVSTPELSFETWTKFEYFCLKYLMLPNSFMKKILGTLKILQTIRKSINTRKILHEKKMEARDIFPLVEYMPIMHEALNLNRKCGFLSIIPTLTI